jgi:hypothetical protein
MRYASHSPICTQTAHPRKPCLLHGLAEFLRTARHSPCDVRQPASPTRCSRLLPGLLPTVLSTVLLPGLLISLLGTEAAAQNRSQTPASRPATQRPSGNTGNTGNNSSPAARPANSNPSKTSAPNSPQAPASAQPTAGPAGPGVRATATASSPVTADGRYILEHKLVPGQLLRSRTVHYANTHTRILGVEDISESRTTSDKVWEVKEVTPDGLMTFEYRIEAVDMSQRVGDGEEVTFNSRVDKEAPPVFARVAETIAKPIAVVTIDRAGKIVERDTRSKAPPMGMGELAMPLPTAPVELGAQWDIPREARVQLENGTQKVIKIRELYTLEKVSAGVATIRIESQPITPVADSSIEAQLCQQLSAGVAKFDIDKGQLISKELNWDKTVVGFRGAETSLKYLARFTEEVEETPLRAARK